MSETVNETPTPADAPEKIYICPACGQRYDEPTTCANGHPPTEAIEYDRATVVAADSGDAAAIAAVADVAAAAGNTAGAVQSEASPADLAPPPPTPAEVVPAVDPAPTSGEPVPAGALGDGPHDDDGPHAEPTSDVTPEPAPAAPSPEVPEADLALLAQIKTALQTAISHAQAALDELAKLEAEAGIDG